MQFGKIQRVEGVIPFDEFEKLMESEDQLDQVEDRRGLNPFTNEEVIFSGKGKAFYRVDGEDLGNLSLESGVVLTTGVPRDVCEKIALFLRADLSEDDRS